MSRHGREITINGAAGTTWYVWCGAHICQSENGDGTIDRQYYPEGEYLPSSAASLYCGPDRLGSVRHVWATSLVVPDESL